MVVGEILRGRSGVGGGGWVSLILRVGAEGSMLGQLP